MLDAAKAAEALIVASEAGKGDEEDTKRIQGPNEQEEQTGRVNDGLIEDEAEGSASPAPSTLSLPASSTAGIDVSTLTPQTFLVRPTRPDANRNRGKNAFKRKPKPKPPVQSTEAGAGTGEVTGADRIAAVTVPAAPIVPATTVEEEDGSEEDPFDEDIVQEMEHLQLGLEEAWFLATAIGALKIHDPVSVSVSYLSNPADTRHNAPPTRPPTHKLTKKDTFIPPSALLPHLLTSYPAPSPLLNHSPSTGPTLLPDDPFLISYVSYHHFRSLGWVVKPGIKFSCDWLLYRKGPVFSHSAFACVVVPVYEDQEDKEKSMHGQKGWVEERSSWKWMNTVMRVNSLVQKVSFNPTSVIIGRGCREESPVR